MGLFSSKKIITVSSTLYNMAGPEDERPNYLKGTLFSSVMSDAPSLGESITNSYFDGPGLKQRAFFRYSDRNDIAGLPTTTVSNTAPADPAVVGPEIPIPSTPANLQLSVQNSQVNEGDPEAWIQRWLLENHPLRISEDWLGEFDPDLNEFSVQFPNGDFFSWTNNIAPVYDPEKRYIQANYYTYLGDNTQAVVLGPVNSITTLPDLTGFTKDSDTATFTNVTLTRTRTTIWSYNNGDPDVTHENAVNADVAGVVDTDTEVWTRQVTIGQAGFETEAENQTWNLTATDHVTNDYTDVVVTTTDLGGGVIRTETATTTGEQVTDRWDARYDTQQVLTGSVVGEFMFIYEIGTGNATLDALASDADASNFQEFFPFLPLRLNNKALDHPDYVTNGLYDETRIAYRRATNNKNIDGLLEQIADNPDIGDIDYAYIMYGVSLNVEEQACRKYIFKFFEEMRQFENAPAGSMTSFEAEVAQYESDLAALETWENTDWSGTPYGDIPARPATPKISVPSTTSLNLRTGSALMPSYDIRMQWVASELTQTNGVFTYVDPIGGDRPAKKGELQLVDGPTVTWQEREGLFFNFGVGADNFRLVTKSIPSLYIYWQTEDNVYRRMQIWGLTHYNYIYGGKSVKITSAEALADNDISGFIVPLHYPTMKNMSIVDYTQMATANVHILFNSYQVTKQKWYQRGIFKILLVIVIIVVAVVLNPGAFAAGSGILGGNLAVGAALGLAGTAALVAGVVANYLAAIIVAELLKIVGTELFGEKWGALFAAIAGFALGAAVSGIEVFSAEGILQLGNAVANGYAGWVAADIAEGIEELEEDRDDYEKRMEYIDDLIKGLGGNDLNFNPIFLTDSLSGNGRRGGRGGYLPETADEFIRRTTMTGGDVVDVTLSMVYDFVDVQKTLPRN